GGGVFEVFCGFDVVCAVVWCSCAVVWGVCGMAGSVCVMVGSVCKVAVGVCGMAMGVCVLAVGVCVLFVGGCVCVAGGPLWVWFVICGCCVGVSLDVVSCCPEVPESGPRLLLALGVLGPAYWVPWCTWTRLLGSIGFVSLIG
ncbi:unnamed protein product, partial [Meganyctiphanes norvegica]